MFKYRLSWLLLAGWGSITQAAPAAPLAAGIAPPCSSRAGIRTARSELVQLGSLSASISFQSSREARDGCLQNASLWVTRRDVSEQFELTDAARNSFEILDISPDASSIFLAARPNSNKTHEDGSLKVAVLPVAAGSSTIKWIPLSELLGLQNCDAVFEPQGFADGKHIIVEAIPGPTGRSRADCSGSSAFYSINLETHRVNVTAMNGTNRLAQAVAGPVQSCRADPDAGGACFTTRARLELGKQKDGSMLVWTLGSLHLLGVDPGLVPAALRSEVNPETRVYATMVICPLITSTGSRRSICIESAKGLKLDPAPGRRATVRIINDAVH